MADRCSPIVGDTADGRRASPPPPRLRRLGARQRMNTRNRPAQRGSEGGLSPPATSLRLGRSRLQDGLRESRGAPVPRDPWRAREPSPMERSGSPDHPPSGSLKRGGAGRPGRSHDPAYSTGWNVGRRPFHQPGGHLLIESMDPVPNGSWRISEPADNLRGGHSLGHKQEPAESRVAARFVGATDLGLAGEDRTIGVEDRQGTQGDLEIPLHSQFSRTPCLVRRTGRRA